jgi:hypothetical protein
MWIAFIVVLVLAFLIGVPVAAIVGLRKSRLHSRRKWEEQRKLDAKKNLEPEPQTHEPGNEPGFWKRMRGSWKGLSSKLGFGIVLVIVIWEGIFGFYAMSDAHRPSWLEFIPHWGTPSMATAGEWVWTNWLPVLILYGSVMGMLAILSKGSSWGKEAKAMQLVATASLLVGFIGLPVLSEAPRLVVAERICPAASAFQTRTCNANIRWSAGFSIDPKEGIADSGMHLCRTAGGHMQKFESNGTTFFQVRSDDGTTPISYRLYPHLSRCPDILPS